MPENYEELANAVRQSSTDCASCQIPIPEPLAREFQSGTVYHPVPAEVFDRIIEESLKIPPLPTRLLWGDHDALFSRAEQDAFQAAVPGARLKVYDETGHCPNWERPEWVAGDIADFVATFRV